MTRTLGIPQYEVTKLDAMTKARVLDGFQIGFHAIGDKGCADGTDAFAGAEKEARGEKGESGEWRRRLLSGGLSTRATTPAQILKFKEPSK